MKDSDSNVNECIQSVVNKHPGLCEKRVTISAKPRGNTETIYQREKTKLV